MDVSHQLGRLVLQLACNVLTDAFHRAMTTTARSFLFEEVVVVYDLWQLVPIDLSFATATGMAGNATESAYRAPKPSIIPVGNPD